jgi:hypothetical protein
MQQVRRDGRDKPGHDEKTMSPDSPFLLSLALRMAVAAAFVVIASMITERSGPAIGALIATLPVSAGPSYIFLAIDHDDAFIAQSALASLPMNAATVLMSLRICSLAQRCGLPSASRRARRVDRMRLLVRAFALAARGRHCLQRRGVRALPAAGAALPRRQDAADHAAAGTTFRCAPRWSRRLSPSW